METKAPFYKKILKILPIMLFAFSLCFFSVFYGMAAMHYKLFPYNMLEHAMLMPSALFPKVKKFHWYFKHDKNIQSPVAAHTPEKMMPGLTKIVDVENDFSLAVKVIDGQGNDIQHWTIDWAKVFPEPPAHFESLEIPKTRPGTHIHGAEILSNGDVVFNFEHLALVRMDPCGNVVWKLPVRSHHSVFIDEKEYIWVSAQLNHSKPLKDFPLFKPLIIEPVILKVAPDGTILEQKSVFDLLIENHQQGALYATTAQNFLPIVTGDLLHLNDVEVFPESMTPGFFKPGDIMISLRNINTVMVFDSNWQLKYTWADEFVRQHDPDFIDGNHISVIDNNNVGTRKSNPQSRVLIKSVDTGETKVAFTGGVQLPFFTNILGKHQWLNNGNLLISESIYGHVLEISPQGEIVWEYYNVDDAGWIGIIEEAQRLPEYFGAEFFEKNRTACGEK